MSIGIIGKKVGMTRIYDAGGKLTPVTVIAAGATTFSSSARPSKTDGYEAVQVGFDTQKKQRVTKARTRPLREGRFRAEEGSARVSSQERRGQTAKAT